MICFFREAFRTKAASLLMAVGCNPNSGSSMMTVSGNSGCKSKVAKAIKRSVPSEKLLASKYMSDSTSSHSKVIVSGDKGLGLSLKLLK